MVEGLNIEARVLVLPHSDVSDFVESSWEALYSLRSERGAGVGGRWCELEEGREWELG